MTKRFKDLKNYPRGFKRSGDFNLKEAEILESKGCLFLELEKKEIKPKTKEEISFIKVCFGEKSPQTLAEKVWSKYKKQITKKKIYTLSISSNYLISEKDIFSSKTKYSSSELSTESKISKSDLKNHLDNI